MQADRQREGCRRSGSVQRAWFVHVPEHLIVSKSLYAPNRSSRARDFGVVRLARGSRLLQDGANRRPRAVAKRSLKG
jgi:hypothetical protein